MQLSELVETVLRTLELSGSTATVTLVLAGRWGKRDTKRLCPGGPIGRIMSEATGGGLIVQFGGLDLAAFLTARGLMRMTIVRRDGVEGGEMIFEATPEAAT